MDDGGNDGEEEVDLVDALREEAPPVRQTCEQTDGDFDVKGDCEADLDPLESVLKVR